MRSESPAPGERKIYEMDIIVDQEASYKTIADIVAVHAHNSEWKIKGPMTFKQGEEDMLKCTVFAKIVISKIGDAMQSKLQRSTCERMVSRGVSLAGRLQAEYD